MNLNQNTKLFFFVAISFLLSAGYGLSENSLNPAANLTNADCIDPDLDKLIIGESLTLCDGSIGEGRLELDATKIRQGVVLSGVTGTAPQAASACTSEAQIGCTANTDYPAAEISGLSSKVLSGQFVAGVGGSATAASTPDPWDIRAGVTVGYSAGKLKTNCRNRVNDGIFGSNNDESTIDDLNDTGTALPGQFPWGEDSACGVNGLTDPNWEKVTTVPATSGDESVFLDKISGMRWTRGSATSSRNHANSLTYCNSTLNAANAGAGHGGINVWRLPTQKEAMAAHNHGIFDLDSGISTVNNLGTLNGTQIWTASSYSPSPTMGWQFRYDQGYASITIKISSQRVLCTAD